MVRGYKLWRNITAYVKVTLPFFFSSTLLYNVWLLIISYAGQLRIRWYALSMNDTIPVVKHIVLSIGIHNPDSFYILYTFAINSLICSNMNNWKLFDISIGDISRKNCFATVFRCFEMEIKQQENIRKRCWIPWFTLTERKLLFTTRLTLQVWFF